MALQTLTGDQTSHRKMTGKTAPASGTGYGGEGALLLNDHSTFVRQTGRRLVGVVPGFGQ